MKYPKARLHILGGTNDEDYKNECLSLIETLNIEDVYIRGQVNVLETIKEFDFTILTSISEGQPLVILESFAAKRPVVSTNVGSCKEMIYGILDNHMQAGFCCDTMDSIELANSMFKLCNDKEMLIKFGETGCDRVKRCYGYDKMIFNYLNAYKEAEEKWQV
jgi:glycosyltransferase involved in cell wall biosynthesis